MNTATEHLGALGTAVALPTGEISSAQLWELHGQEWLEASNAPDIYELLDKWGNTWETATHHPHAFAVLTTGWAAPLGDNGAVEGQPSKHPQRRRVVLFCVVSAAYVSVLAIWLIARIVSGGGGSGSGYFEWCVAATWS